MRLAAGALIVAAFALAALGSVARAKRRARLLEALCASLELLRGEVVTRLTPLPDCAALLSRTGPAECREFYASLGLAMDSLGELEFSRLWEACVSALELGEEAQSALADLGRSLGRYAAAEQGAAIDRCLARLGPLAARERAALRDSARLKLGLGLSAGLLLAVILY